MKKLIILSSVLLTSCVSSTFYQVYQTNSYGNETIEATGYVYEDANCKLYYDFWGISGDIGFFLYNISDENIYVNLAECFYVCNGAAYDYYLNREYGKNTSVTTSSPSSKTEYDNIIALSNLTNSIITAIAASQGVPINTSNNYISTNYSQNTSVSQKSITYHEKNIICIPPKSYKRISEYSINDVIYRYCDLLLYPNKKQIDTLTFTLLNSPIVFGNRIAYTKGNSDSLIRFENNFFVSAICNYPESEIKKYEIDTFCGESQFGSEYKAVITIQSPLMFYNTYMLTNSLKH